VRGTHWQLQIQQVTDSRAPGFLPSYVSKMGKVEEEKISRQKRNPHVVADDPSE